MLKKERLNNIKITLSLIALSLPLFAKYSVTAQNGCPYETYVKIDDKCLDISQEGLNNMTEALSTSSVKEVKEVNEEIEELNEELEELGEELEKLCVQEQPQSKSEIEIIEEVCQY